MVVSQDVGIIAGLGDKEEICFIRLLEDKGILRGIGADRVPPQTVWPLGGIQCQIKEGPAVVGPLHTGMVVNTAKGISDRFRIKELLVRSLM